MYQQVNHLLLNYLLGFKHMKSGCLASRGTKDCSVPNPYRTTKNQDLPLFWMLPAGMERLKYNSAAEVGKAFGLVPLSLGTLHWATEHGTPIASVTPTNPV